MFTYSSVTSHGVVTSDGEKVKETHINISNGKGTKTLILKKNNLIHSDTLPLKKSEIKNIQKHRFMPNLFHKLSKKVRKQKSSKRITKKKVSKK
jgi:hypothetical protein